MRLLLVIIIIIIIIVIIVPAARYYCTGRTIFIGIALAAWLGGSPTADPSRKDLINYDYVIIFIVGPV